MKTTTRILCFTSFVFFTLNLFSQINSLPGSYNWSMPSAWSGGVVPGPGDVVNIVSNSTINLDVPVIHNSDINILDGGMLMSMVPTNDLTVNNANVTLSGFSAVLNFGGSGSSVPVTINNGHVINGGVFMSGDLYILYTLVGPSSDNNGDMMIAGNFELDGSATFNNNTGVFVNGLCQVNNGTTFNNNNSASLTNVHVDGTMNNLGYCTVSDSLQNNLNGVVSSAANDIYVTNNVNNLGQFTVSDSLQVGGSLMNSGVFTNNGGAVNIDNNLLNSGTLTGASSGNYYIAQNSENTATGAINGTIDVCDATLTPGNYLDVDNGTANVDFVNVTFCSMSYASLEEASIHFDIYPNPTSGIITIEHDETVHVTIITQDGRKVFEKDLDSQTVDLEGLASGFYMLTIERGQDRFTTRLVKN